MSLKRKRESPGEPAHKKVGITGQKAINVMDVARERQAEVKGILKMLADQDRRSGKRVFQRLPRHMRRRAMSHNMHRVPAKVRAAGFKELKRDPQHKEDSHKAVSRNLRRRRSRLQSEKEEIDIVNPLSTEDDGECKAAKWLATHVWQAKRMHMMNLWGMRLPWTPQLKSFRSSYRFAKNSCTIHDASYFHVVAVKLKTSDGSDGSGELLVAKLRDFGIHLTRNTSIEWKGHLHRPKAAGNGCMGPARTWLHADRNLAWIWIHPSIVSDAVDLLSSHFGDDADVEVVENAPGRFELVGPGSHSLLVNTLRVICDGSPSANFQNEVWAQLSILQNTGSLQRGCMLALNVHDPRLVNTGPGPQLAQDIPIREQQHSQHPLSLLPGGSMETFNEMQQDFANFLCKEWSAEAGRTVLWSDAVRRELRNDMEAEKDINKRRSLLPARVDLLPASDSTINPTIMLVQRSIADDDVLAHDVNSYGTGWDLICPRGWERVFWSALVRAGAKAIGLKERMHQSLECGVPSFPQDFPETPAGKAWLTARAKAFEEVHTRKPPAKRMNYASVKTSAPFGFAENAHGIASIQNVSVVRDDSVDSFVDTFSSDALTKLRDATKTPAGTELLVPFRLSPFGRGLPEDNAVIYRPTAADLDNMTEVGDEHFELNEPVSSSQDESKMPIRVEVGMLSTGDYSLLRGKGIGIALLRSSLLAGEGLPYDEESDGFFCLFRNPQSRVYRLGLLFLACGSSE